MPQKLEIIEDPTFSILEPMNRSIDEFQSDFLKIVSGPKNLQFNKLTIAKYQFTKNLIRHPRPTWFCEQNAPLCLIIVPKMAKV